MDLDFREGGRYFINMIGSSQAAGGMTGEFESIEENARIVMTDYFADEAGRAITAAEAKIPGVWPKTVFITLEFKALSESSSRLTLFQEGIPTEGQDDCANGWSQMFDKLEGFLAKPARL